MFNYVNTLFNIDLLILNKENVKNLKQVKSVTIFEPSTQNFTEDGLFSVSIFGPVGSKERMSRLAYIDLKVKVLHPLLFEHITSMSKFFKDIMHGKTYATFDKKDKTFKPASIEDGETGYSFFISHLKDIKFTNPGEGDQREYKIKLLDLFNNEKGLLDKWLVLPAGLRDYTVSADGKPSEDEVNKLYKRLIITTNLLNNITISKENMKSIDPIVIKIQTTIDDIYQHFKVLLDGKSKFIQGKWAKRAVVNGTRNVLTPTINNMTKLHQEDAVSVDDIVVGLYQYSRAALPIVINRLRTVFINKFISPDNETCKLVDPKTMKTKLVTIDPKKKTEWTSFDGLDNVVSKLKQRDIRDKPVMVDGYYLCLVHDRNNVINIIYNTELVDDSFEEKYIRPITYAEMVYISIFEIRRKYPALATRYPAIELGSIFPGKVYIRTTENPRKVKVVMDTKTIDMFEYPKKGADYIDSMSVPVKQLASLGADYDGDMYIR